MQIGHCAVTDLSPHETGRRLLAQMYAQRFGTPMPPITIGPRGKPYFPDGHVHFSITHTPRHVFCVLADRPVGIDAEETDRQVNLCIADKVLSPAEKRRFRESDDPRAALLRLWVLKEAAGKCSGEGITCNPTDTDFSPADPRIQILHGCYVAVILEE